MELFISMNAETINKGIYFEKSTVMQMPTARTGEVFVAEFREGNKDKLALLKRYVEILEQKLGTDNELHVEHTNYGFKVLKPVPQDKDYMELWEHWVVFSRNLLNELRQILGEEIEDEQ